MCRLSLCLALLMLLVIGSSARAQGEPAKKAREVKRPDKELSQAAPKSGTAERETERKAAEGRSEKANQEVTSESEAPQQVQGEVQLDEAKPTELPTLEKSEVRERNNTEQENQAQGEEVSAEKPEHGHEHDSGCDSYKDADAKKKCEEEKKARLLVPDVPRAPVKKKTEEEKEKPPHLLKQNDPKQ